MTTMNGRTFDWQSYHDPASRNFAARAALPPAALIPAHRFWTPPPWVLDQGREGECVSFGWSAELGSSPVRVPGITDQFARALFVEVRLQDREMGNFWDEGASVLAGARACKKRGLIGEYRWSFGPDDLRNAVLALGPAVIGIPYKPSMFQPRPSGLVEVVEDGSWLGHCMCITGFHPRMRIPKESYRRRFAVYKVRQSWGGDFGRRGDIYIQEDSMSYLLSARQQGEACIPLQRNRISRATAARMREGVR